MNLHKNSKKFILIYEPAQKCDNIFAIFKQN